MADVTKLRETQEEQGERSEPVHLEEECCVPFCGPDTCVLPLLGDSGQELIRTQPASRNKVVKLSRAGARRLFNGEDDEIYSREDLIEKGQDGTIKVVGACTGTVWLLHEEEIIGITDA